MWNHTVADDAGLARHLAGETGRELLALREKLGFGDSAQLRREGDLRGNEIILAALAEARPGDAVLSEEGEGENGRSGTARLDAARVWIVDPLDGTREFGESGRTDWAVHVALWADGDLAVGAVALPAQSAVLVSDRPPVPAPRSGPIRIAVSRSRPPAFLDALAVELDAELVPIGSAGAKVSAVVLGKVDAYVHAGGQYEWDSAAPVAVARASGLFTSRINGDPLTYNNPDPRLDDLLVCRSELAQPILAAIADAR
ncbi:3'(2'),5'-bisphosphate nucleotidase [Stackebrandtia albiflava]|uniref:3'(2'),5'-bisphosphate nucleotidase n=1 Tax=Stackebrandtia albiflava TaxID=406432 RepID=A0A562V3I6_9ACTN|nr:3'(2'),5'-bisphosphate nucleotidase CysQ [Stackebrandtia albiflava]TWJ12444.1 3'(2'),5'-bisphosphate nucleotidase [Stackebrandtia albiflava]